MNALPVSPAIRRWQARFAAEPVQAIGDLLAGRVFLGPFARARPSEALVQILTPEQIPLADQLPRERGQLLPGTCLLQPGQPAPGTGPDLGAGAGS